MSSTSPHHWAFDSIFYHIYPLGLCGAPARNDFSSPATPRLEKINTWIPHLRELGVNALYLGPLFESTAHGYDTADYYHVDRRLGSDQTLAQLTTHLHQNGLHVILDGVFNHVGRDFWAFRDVQQNREASAYCDWFQGLNFGGHSPYGDAFSYEGWNGNYDLVKLNLQNADVRHHLFEAVRSWVQKFEIDGLRLDAADCLDLDFLKELRIFTQSLRLDFWLMGEIVAGDYRRWANPEMLDSVTNYECYKGLYSSLVDKNYFEIAYSLKRQFGAEGLYRNLPLFNFADNHDVNRVASNLTTPAHLYPLYCLLLTMPGVPSIYYGSEWGLTGKRTPSEDAMLRPCLDLATARQNAPAPNLERVIARLAAIRRGSDALKYGEYQQVYVSHEQFAFLRQSEHEKVLVVLNAAATPVALDLPLPCSTTHAVDLLNPGEVFYMTDNRLMLPSMPSCWGRILRLDN